MNEQIREFAIQSGSMEWGDSVIPATMNIEKFAELIIQECAKEAFEFWCSQDDPTEGSAENHILKRFGVKS